MSGVARPSPHGQRIFLVERRHRDHPNCLGIAVVARDGSGSVRDPKRLPGDEHLRSRDECCRDGFRSNRANGAVPVDKSCVVIQDDVARVTMDLDDNRTRFETPRLTVGRFVLDAHGSERQSRTFSDDEGGDTLPS